MVQELPEAAQQLTQPAYTAICASQTLWFGTEGGICLSREGRGGAGISPHVRDEVVLGLAQGECVGGAGDWPRGGGGGGAGIIQGWERFWDQSQGEDGGDARDQPRGRGSGISPRMRVEAVLRLAMGGGVLGSPQHEGGGGAGDLPWGEGAGAGREKLICTKISQKDKASAHGGGKAPHRLRSRQAQ